MGGEVMAAPAWICQLVQLPERGEAGEFVEAGGVAGRVQPRRQARGRRRRRRNCEWKRGAMG